MRPRASASTRSRPPRKGRDPSKGLAEHGPEKTLFLRFLTGKKLKLTRQREAIVDEILTTAGHFEPEDIVLGLRAKRVRASRATVYRTIELLMECRLVEKLDLGGGGSYYEHTHLGEHHDHLICTQCGNVIEFHNAKLESVQADVCSNFDFQETHHSLRIFGLCSKCRQTAR